MRLSPRRISILVCWTASTACGPTSPTLADGEETPSFSSTLVPPEASSDNGDPLLSCDLSACPEKEFVVKLPPCCTVESPSLCGNSLSALVGTLPVDSELGQCAGHQVPGVFSEACPSTRLEGIFLFGCCRERDGTCGLRPDFGPGVGDAGFGCQPSQLFLDLVPLTYCDPP